MSKLTQSMASFIYKRTDYSFSIYTYAYTACNFSKYVKISVIHVKARQYIIEVFEFFEKRSTYLILKLIVSQKNATNQKEPQNIQQNSKLQNFGFFFPVKSQNHLRRTVLDKNLLVQSQELFRLFTVAKQCINHTFKHIREVTVV